jgi:chromosome segregation ATPase
MNISGECQSLLTAFDLIKQELSTFLSKDIHHQPSSLEDQIRRFLEASDKLIQSLLAQGNFIQSSSEKQIQELNKKYLKVENLYSISEENLKKSRSEIKYLKGEIKNLEKSQGNNNLFTVEVYQSEIEDLRKDHKEKMTELQVQIANLSSSNLQKSYIELRNKYLKVKDQLISLRSKIKDFEEVLADNNEQKKKTEMKYLELVGTHKKMFGYIEKLELKVRKFQEVRRKKDKSLTESSKQSESSLVLSL